MSTLKLDTIASRDGTESTDVTNVINGSAKAWVNFNGTGTVAIRRSFNVSSITDNGTGDYTVNFTNAMEDANYAVNAISLPTSDFRERIKLYSTGGYSSTAFGIANANAGDTHTYYDSTIIAVTVFS